MNPNMKCESRPGGRLTGAVVSRGGLLALLFTALLNPALADDRTVEETRAMAADGSVVVENEFGDISIQGWSRNEVRVVGDLSDDVKELEIRESGNSVRIRVEYYDRRNIHGAELEVMIPDGASVQAESVSGDIEVIGLSGETIELTTVSGDLEVAASAQRLNLSTVSGDVDFSGTSSRIAVESVSGEIELSGVSGEIDASTVSGDVTVYGGEVSSGEFEAVSGDVELRIDLNAGGRIKVSSMSGDIDLYLPGNQQAEFLAQTFSGDIYSDFGRVKNSSSRGPGERLEHLEGENGATINLNSFSGDVSIQKR